MAVSLPLCEWLKAEGARFDTVDSFGVGSLLMAIEGQYAAEDDDDDDEDEDDDEDDDDDDDDDDDEDDDEEDVDENAQNGEGIRNEVAEDEDELPNMDDEAIEARRLRREALAEAREARRAAHARRLERRTALEESKLALCRWLLAEGVRVNGREGGVNGREGGVNGQDGQSARQQESNGSVEGPRAVSRSGPDDGLTPLHMACGMGFVRMAQVRSECI
jgi:hypothetical protein